MLSCTVHITVDRQAGSSMLEVDQFTCQACAPSSKTTLQHNLMDQILLPSIRLLSLVTMLQTFEKGLGISVASLCLSHRLLLSTDTVSAPM